MRVFLGLFTDQPVPLLKTHLCLAQRPTCVSVEDPPVSLMETHLCL